MKTKEAIDLFLSYQKSTHRKRTLQSYLPLLLRFGSQYGKRLLKTIGPEEVFHFLEGATAGRARSRRRLRYAQLKAFYNFIINRCGFEMRNPCSVSLVSKAFKGAKPVSRKIPEKELIDEPIYNTQNLRDRLILELQAPDRRIPEDQGLRCVRKEDPAEGAQIGKGGRGGVHAGTRCKTGWRLHPGSKP